MASSSWCMESFGDLLVTKRGAKNAEEVLKGKKFVGLYFGAAWCPPCKAFTPDLADFYEDVCEANKSTLEIIFVSSDSDKECFRQYFGEMPWTAVPFEESDIKDDLITDYEMLGIPMFIVLNGKDGSVIDRDARATVLDSKGDIQRALTKWGTLQVGSPK